ncbi:hypothetical protein HYT54_02740 [Candidatus Woesearchaeota archaeon]|nr:hypothetical protein [Candidatus Woesearchaeota archaeon]
MAKKESGNRIKTAHIAVAVLIVLAVVLLASRKPTVTGFAAITKETDNKDNLNLVVNESRNMSWTLKNPGNIKSLAASGEISRNGSAKVYIKKGDEKKLIFDSTRQLFDVNIMVLPDYKKIVPGGDLLIEITLFNLRGFGSFGVDVKYSIKTQDDRIVAAEQENVIVETQAKFVRKLIIPSDFRPGTYNAYVEVNTPDGLAGTSTDLFEVLGEVPRGTESLQYYALAVVALLVLIGIIFLVSGILRKLRSKREVLEIKGREPGEKIAKVEKEISALEQAFKEKLISQKSYDKEKARMEDELRKLRKGK